MTPKELLATVDRVPTGKLLVAVSGGVDSAVAAWVCSELAGSPVRAIHVNHRTAAATMLEKAATSIASQLGIEFVVRRVTVASGPSWEGQARTARWDAIEKVRTGDETVVTGHHRGDLAETVLGNMLRGAGAAGLASMAVNRPGIWRPLIDASKWSIQAVGTTLGLAVSQDPSNDDRSIRRNAIRHELIPLLAAEYNPLIIHALARAARSLAADDALLQQMSLQIPIVTHPYGAYSFDRTAFDSCSDSVRSRVARNLLRVARPPYAGDASEIEAVSDVAAGRRPSATISDAWQVANENGRVTMYQTVPTADKPAKMVVPGSMRWGEWDLEFLRGLEGARCVLDASAIGPNVTVRGVRPGDRIDIKSGSKPVREAMAEGRVPCRLRSAWPIVEVDGRIAAIAGVRAAAWARGINAASDVCVRVGEFNQ